MDYIEKFYLHIIFSLVYLEIRFVKTQNGKQII